MDCMIWVLKVTISLGRIKGTRGLGRFCGSVEWSLLFPEAEVFHLDEDISHHLPILLKFYGQSTLNTKHWKQFKFENM